jgi:hypothetical protein
MLLFRSEGHIDRWCAQWSQPRGGTLSLEQGWNLAQAWYGQDRREVDWRRKTLEEATAAFEAIGMVGPFWQLSG